MNDLFIKNETMSIADVSSVLGVSTEAIKKQIRSIFPEIIKNGIATRLNEFQVTEIKKNMIPTTAVVGSKTSIEEDLILIQAVEIANRRMIILKSKNKSLQIENDKMKPKALFYDEVSGSKSALSMSEAAKIIDSKMGRNKLFLFLRDQGILRYNNEPYQKYIDNGWFRVVEQKYNVPSGDIQISIKTLVFQKGVDGIIKLLGKR